MEIKYTLIREVKPPKRGTQKSAGFDFFIPEFTEEYIKDIITNNKNEVNKTFMIFNEGLVLGSNANILLPSGVKMNLHELPDMALIANNKSGIASKKGLTVMAEVVDQDYQGEIFLNVANVSPYLQQIEPNQKLVQFLYQVIKYPDLKRVPIEDLFEYETERGEGSKGSTGK